MNDTTTGLVKRMEALGWGSKTLMALYPDGGACYWGDDNKGARLSDLHARDLLTMDFARWIIASGKNVIMSNSQTTVGWGVALLDGGFCEVLRESMTGDLLPVLVSAAEQALKGEQR